MEVFNKIRRNGDSMNNNDPYTETLRYQALDADGLPFMSIHAHPSTSGETLIEMLQEAIENIKHETRPGAKVVSLEEFRKKESDHVEN